MGTGMRRNGPRVAVFLLCMFLTCVFVPSSFPASNGLYPASRGSNDLLPPDNVSALRVSEDVVEVSWDPPLAGSENITHYGIYRSIANGTWSLVSTPIAQNGRNNYYDRDLVLDREFGYHVVSMNETSSSRQSMNASLILYASPNAPLNLTYEPGDGKIFLKWVPPVPRIYSGIDGYRVRIFFEGEWTEPSATGPGDSTSWEITGLQNGKEYIVRLFAFNEHGDSEFTEIMFRPGRPPDPPSNVGIRFMGRDAELTWNAPKDNGGFPVTRYFVIRQVEDGPEVSVAAKDPNDRSYSDHGLEEGIHYHYNIRAENELGLSEKSTVVTAFTPIIYTVPQAPTIHRYFTGQLWIRIEWKPPREQGGAPVLEYVIYRTNLDNGRFENITRVDANTTSLNDTDIEFNINYTYRVSAVNRIGESGKSNSVTLSVRNASEPLPTNGTVRERKNNRAIIFGMIAGIVIVAAAMGIYFVMTYRGRIEPPPDVGPEEAPDHLSRGPGRS
ncbi:MAG: fibronectin type III domain-containing protein [Thermoplasmatota archaeon]